MSWIEELIAAFQQVRDGNTEVKIDDPSIDPRVAEAFRQMVESLSGRQLEIESYLDSAETAIAEMQASYEEITALQLLSSSLSTTFELEEVLSLFMNLAGEIVRYE